MVECTEKRGRAMISSSLDISYREAVFPQREIRQPPLYRLRITIIRIGEIYTALRDRPDIDKDEKGRTLNDLLFAHNVPWRMKGKGMVRVEKVFSVEDTVTTVQDGNRAICELVKKRLEMEYPHIAYSDIVNLEQRQARWTTRQYKVRAAKRKNRRSRHAL